MRPSPINTREEAIEETKGALSLRFNYSLLSLKRELNFFVDQILFWRIEKDEGWLRGCFWWWWEEEEEAALFQCFTYELHSTAGELCWWSTTSELDTCGIMMMREQKNRNRRRRTLCKHKQRWTRRTNKHSDFGEFFVSSSSCWSQFARELYWNWTFLHNWSARNNHWMRMRISTFASGNWIATKEFNCWPTLLPNLIHTSTPIAIRHQWMAVSWSCSGIVVGVWCCAINSPRLLLLRFTYIVAA